MAEFSSTLYDSSKIEIIGGHSAAQTSGASFGGQALSEIAHGSGAGLRYFEVELTAAYGSNPNYFGVGFTSSTTSLTDWIGSSSQTALFFSAGYAALYQSASSLGTTGAMPSPPAAGIRLGLWLDPATRKVWTYARPHNGYHVGNAYTARPDLGTGETWTVPGTGDIYIAVSPFYGVSGNRNILRLHTKRSEFLNQNLYGATAWSARTSTVETTLINPVTGLPIASATAFKWAWFDEVTPDIKRAPMSQGSGTVGIDGAVSIAVSTCLDAGGIGWLEISNSDGTVTQCRASSMPIAAP